MSSVTIAAAIGELHDIANADHAVQGAIDQLGLIVAAFTGEDAFAVSVLAREVDTPVDLADLASIALALRLDGQAVFIGSEKARLKGLAPANLVFV